MAVESMDLKVDMKQRLLEALKKANADYAEIRFEENDGTSFAYRGKELEAASTACNTGGIVRACKNGGWGTCVFDSLDDLEQKVADACADAALVGKEKTQLAEIETPADVVAPVQMKHDYRGVPFADKLAVIKEYNDIILGQKGMESSSVSYSEQFRKVYFASTRGNYFMEERPRITLALSGVARNGSQVQRAHESFSSTNDYDIVLNHQDKALEVAQRTLDLLKAPKCEGGRYTVIMDPVFAGVFAHEAFGHLSEADFLFENPQMRDLMKIGRVMGNPDLNITDDGTLATLLGTQMVDDEGTPMTRTHLIKDGILAGHLHSLETAAKMGEKPTGNARAIRRGCSPIVRMTNTFIEPGNQTKEELFAGVDDGIYACGAFGGQTMMEMFTFSAAYGYRIRKGKICELLRDIVLTGNVFETLKDIDGIADDLLLPQHGGGCGKGGQAPLPVTCGAPHIRIRNVVVGGKA